MYNKNNVQTVCFTGPRPKKLLGVHGSQSEYNKIIDVIYHFCEKLYLTLNCKIFISGGAQGFDQLAFKAVNNLKQKYPDIKNIVYIPFTGYDKQWNEYGLFTAKEFENELKNADEIKYISKSFQGVHNNGDIETAATILNARNEAMVNDSDIVIAMYKDDSWLYEEHSGTANCMRYAKSMQKPIYQLKFNIRPNKFLTSVNMFSDLTIVRAN
jgi:uncharacterized phage-like protein YoqJ